MREAIRKNDKNPGWDTISEGTHPEKDRIFRMGKQFRHTTLVLGGLTFIFLAQGTKQAERAFGRSSRSLL